MKNKIFSIIALLLAVTMFAGCSFTSLITPVPTDTPASEIPSVPVSAEPAPVTETQQPAPETQTAPIAEITSEPVSETVTGTPVPEPTAEPKTETPTPEPTPEPAPKPTSKPTPAPTPKPEETPHTDIGYWVQYAENYAVSLGFIPNDWVFNKRAEIVLSTGHMLKGKAERKIKQKLDTVKADSNYNWQYIRIYYEKLNPNQVNLEDMDPSYSYYSLYFELAEAGPAPTEPPPIDMDYWVQYAKDYAESIGLEVDPGCTACYDDPSGAFATHEQQLKEDIESCLDDYKRTGKIHEIWVWYTYEGPWYCHGLIFDYYKLYIGYGD